MRKADTIIEIEENDEEGDGETEQAPPSMSLWHTLEATSNRETGVTAQRVLNEFQKAGMPEDSVVTGTQIEMFGIPSGRVRWVAKWREERHG